jgi:hypothetical protein
MSHRATIRILREGINGLFQAIVPASGSLTLCRILLFI